MEVLQQIGIIVCLLCAVASIFVTNDRLRTLFAVIALAVAGTLLVGYSWSTSALEPVRQRPALLIAAPFAATLVLLPFSLCFYRWPGTFLFATAIALPFRIPLSLGSTEANLLLPLYLVIAAGTFTALLKAFRPRQKQQKWDVLETEKKNPIFTEEGRSTQAVFLTLAAFLCLYAIQTVYSSDENRALQQIAFYYAPFTVLFGLIIHSEKNQRWIKRSAQAIFVIATGLALIGCYEYVTHKLLLNPKAINVNIFSSFFRVSSLFFDPSIYGRFLACVFIAGATTILFLPSRTKRNYILALSCGLFIIWIGLLPSFSQSSYIALLIGLLSLFTVRFGVKKVLLPVLFIAVLTGSAIALYPQQTGFKPPKSEREQPADRLTGGRNKLVEGGINLLQHRPIAGYGSGAFSTEYRQIEKINGGNEPVVSHTTPITIGAEQGAIGLIAYFAFLISVLVMFIVKRRASALLTGAFAVFCALVTHSLFYGSFFEDPMTWIVLAVSMLSMQPDEEQDN